MSRFGPETAHHNTDHAKYGPNHDHIFNKKACPCDECRLIGLESHLQSQELGAVSGLSPETHAQASETSVIGDSAVAGLIGK